MPGNARGHTTLFRGHATGGPGDTRGSSGHTARGINCKQLEWAPGTHHRSSANRARDTPPTSYSGHSCSTWKHRTGLGDTPPIVCNPRRGHTTHCLQSHAGVIGDTPQTPVAAAPQRPHPRLPSPALTSPDRAREQGGIAPKAPASKHPFPLSPSIHAESSNPFFQGQSETEPPRATSHLAISSASEALDPPPPQFCRHLFSPVSQHLPPKQWNQRGISRKL